MRLLMRDRFGLALAVGILAAIAAVYFGFSPALVFPALLVGELLYGFHNLEDNVDDLAVDVGLETISDAVREANAFYAEEIRRALSLFVVGGMPDSIGVQPPVEGGRLQGLDQWGRPTPRRMPGKRQRRFPIHMAGDSIAGNWLQFQEMTVQQINDRIDYLQQADANWNRDHMLASMFTNATYPFDDEKKGTYDISVLANNDDEQYFLSGGSAGQQNHFHFDSALGTDTLQAARADLIHHGENGGENGEVVAFLPTTSEQTVRALPGFVSAADANVQRGTAIDTYIGDVPVDYPGKLIGYDEDAQVHLVIWGRIPADYMVTVSTAGLRPVGMREHVLANLRGFIEMDDGRQDLPYWQRIWVRLAGYAIYNRVGAVVTRTNSGVSYAPPANLVQPI